MSTAFVLLGAVCFAGTAWGGSAFGARLAAAQEPLDDAPSPARYARWPFPVLGALVGAASAPALGAPELLLLAVVVGLLAACAATDLRCGIIPDRCSLGALGLVLVAGGVRHDWDPALGAAAVGAAFGLAALLSRGNGMGWGDVKLAAAGGALLGAVDAALAFAIAALVAYAIARRTQRAHVPMAFGHYLAASTAIALTLQRPV